METQEREIIEGSIALFSRYGIRSVTMDEVAREIGISKKTIYKYFSNKADLVEQCVMVVFSAIREAMETIHRSSQNAIDELFEIDEVVGQILEHQDPGLHYQLQKYYPQVAHKLFENRERMVCRMIVENIENGQKVGYYRTDLEGELIAHLYCSKMETLPEENHDFFRTMGVKNIMRQSLIYHIRGIATARGLEYLEAKLNTEINAK